MQKGEVGSGSASTSTSNDMMNLPDTRLTEVFGGAVQAQALAKARKEI